MKSRNVTLNCGTAKGSVRAARSGRRFVASALMLFALGISALLTGCSANFDPKLTGLEPNVSVGTISGKAHGGQAPIYGAAVYIMQTGLSGYPGSSVAANTSLITSGTGTFTGTVNGTSHGTYVLTDFNGNFTINGFTCTPGAGVYLYAVGGQPIAGTTNNASTEMAAMGICPAGGASALAASVPYVNINEVSTAAMAYALGGFTAAGYDATHISSSATNSVGMATAFTNAAIMYNVANNNGANTISPVDPTHSFLPSSQTLNSIANILADCVNSNGSTASNSTPCYILFQNATSNGTTGSGTVPNDTASAMINITHNVQSNISNLFALASNSYAPYTPALSSAPPNFSYVISFLKGNGSTANTYDPNQIVIDSAGTVYVTNFWGSSTPTYLNGIMKITPTAGLIGATAVSNLGSIAIDQSNNVFIYSNSTGGVVVSEYAASTTATLGTSVGTYNLSSLLTSQGLPIGDSTTPNEQVFYSSCFKIGPTNNLLIANFSGTSGANENLYSFPLTAGTYSTSSATNLHSLPNGTSNITIAVDGNGTVYMGDYTGTNAARVTSGGSYSSQTATYYSDFVVLDPEDSINFFDYTTGSGHNGITVFNNSFSASSSVAGGGSNFTQPYNPSMDGLGRYWFGDLNTKNLSARQATGSNVGQSDVYQELYVFGAGAGYSDSGAGSAVSTVPDQAGNLWVALESAQGYGEIDEMVGIAAPTIQPLSLQSLKILPTNTSLDIRP